MEQLQTHRYYDNETRAYYEKEAAKAAVRQERERQKRATEEETPREEKLREIDDILDEIDEILEENAEAFVSSYVQKGGE